MFFKIKSSLCLIAKYRGFLSPPVVKITSDNIFSIRNILKDGYKVIYEYENERGPMTVFVK